MKAFLPLLLVMLALVAGCATTFEPIPEMPEAPEVVRVTVTEYVVPEWLVKRLPEDAPKANTAEEATRLSCVRLGTIQVANCRFALGERLRDGDPISNGDIKACNRHAASRCEVEP